jgi:predicted transposase YbfD/YdcC
MADFGQSKEGLLRLVLRLKHGIPSHDTFSRVFRLLEPEAFERAFRQFMAAFAKSNKLKLSGVVAVDGKALRAAYERGGKTSPLHLVNVFAVDARMVLAQRKAPGRNETIGALEALELLDLEGSIVTADALHCRRAFAAAVLKRGGDYALAIKANCRPLFKAVTRQFTRSGKRSSAKQIDPSVHDRSEARRATVIRNTTLAELHRFSWYRCYRPDHIAQTRERAACRYASRPLLYPVEIHVAEEASTGRPKPLGHREPAALGARRPFLRGSQSDTKGQRARESCPRAKDRTQHPANASSSGLDTPQNQTRRLGRRLPFAGNQSYAIALPDAGIKPVNDFHR